MIDILTPDNGPDEEGYVTMTMRTADDVALPVKITMKKMMRKQLCQSHTRGSRSASSQALTA